MDVITTHIQADFDACAAMIAAHKLYPEAKCVFPGSCEKGLREYIASVHVKCDRLSEIPLSEVSRLILVDTKNPKRIGPFAEVIKNKGVTIHIYDHHPLAPGDVRGAWEVIEPVGATTTILTEILQQKSIDMSPQEATLCALGIYQETGSLRFLSTTMRDLSASAYLLQKGADLRVVSRFLSPELTREQTILLGELLHSCTRYTLSGIEVGLATGFTETYREGLASLTNTLMGIERLDVLFVLVMMEGKLLIIGRSRRKEVDAGALLRTFGGGGHPTAGSASVKDLSLHRAEEKLLRLLTKQIPVTKKEGKSIPVFRPSPTINLQGLLRERAPERIRKVLAGIGSLADQQGVRAYAVGGIVRDLLWGNENLDLDIMVEGDGISFASLYAGISSAEVRPHPRFGTASVSFPDGFSLDITSARKEFYSRPTTLPMVKSGSLVEDLFRRDFTINALAFSLHKGEYGYLIDFFGGYRDLTNRTIRVLHDRSFIEDPTRAFRAVRFEQRLGFSIEPHTANLIRGAVALSLVEKMSGTRLFRELRLSLQEPDPPRVIRRLADMGLLHSLHPDLLSTPDREKLCEQIRECVAWMRISGCVEKVEEWIIYLTALLDGVGEEKVLLFSQRMNCPASIRSRLLQGQKSRDTLRALYREPGMTPSRLYTLLSPFSPEPLLFLMAKAQEITLKRAISSFLSTLKGVKVSVTGHDLVRVGIPPGPRHREILSQTLTARLDGKVTTKEEELEFVRRLISH